MFISRGIETFARSVVDAQPGSVLNMSSHRALGTVTMLGFCLEDKEVGMVEIEYQNIQGMGDRQLNMRLAQAAKEKKVVVITGLDKLSESMTGWFNGHIDHFKAMGGKAVLVRYE